MTENTFKSLCFWSWNDNLEENELRRQINEFKAQNIGGFFIHARAGLKVPYMGEKWFEVVAWAIDEAKNCGLDVWLYDEDGWPSGFADGKVPAQGVDYQQKKLLWKTAYAGEPIEGSRIAAFLVKDGKYQRIDMDHQITQNPFPGEILYFYYETNPYYTDLLNPEAVRYFIAITHEVYYRHFQKEFGGTIKGIFTDEPQLPVDKLPWSFGLEEYFKNANGYSLIDSLPYLVREIDGYQKIRHDFWKTVNKLFVETFTKQIYDWCETHHIMFTGHFQGEDGLCYQLFQNGSVMPHYEFMQLPGIDYLGKRITSPVLIKQVASVSRQFGKKQILSETFGCSGWNMSFADFAWIWGYQVLLGINVPCLHLAAYSIRGCCKRDYPPVFSYQEPWWQEFYRLSSYFENLSKYLTKGVRSIKLLMLHPISGVWCESQTGFNSKMRFISNEFRSLSESLLQLGMDFDYGDETILEKYGQVKNGQMMVNDVEYNMVIVPQTCSIEKSTYILLEELIKQDGKVIFINQLPEMLEGKISNELPKLLQSDNVYVTYNRKQYLEKTFKVIGIEREIEILYKNKDLSCEAILTHVRKVEEGLLVFLWNSNPKSEEQVRISIKDRVALSMLDPINDTWHEMDGHYQNGKTICAINFHAGQAALLKLQSLEFEKLFMDNTNTYVRTESIPGDWAITPLDLNCLTIDMSCFQINDGPWSSPMPIIHMQDRIFQNAALHKEGCKVRVRYEFLAKFDRKPDLIYIVIEENKNMQIFMNGNEIHTGDEWWKDRSFKKILISEKVTNGLNRLEMVYSVPTLQSYMNVDEVFESERNRFSFPVEFENIYVLGDFTVTSDGEISNETQEFIVVNPQRFIVVDRIDGRDQRNIAKSGLWFYSGWIRLRNEVCMRDITDQVYLKIPEPRCVLFKVYINDQYVATCMLPPFEVEITSFVKEGINTVTIEMLLSNRNTFGPHHHIAGENIFVGPSTFKGVQGWEDFMVPWRNGDLWMDDYSFVIQGFSEPPILRFVSEQVVK